MTVGGGQLFKNLPPGRYRAFPRPQGCVPASVTFEVKAGQTTRAAIKLAKGRKLTFRVKETEDNKLPGFPWVGYRITRLGSDKPLFEDENGPLWGDLVPLSDKAPRSSAVQLAPGKYVVTAVLRSEPERSSLYAGKDLWSTTRTITIPPKKDVVIEMAWKE